MNHRTKRMFAGLAVMLMAMCAVFAITFSDEEGNEVDAATETLDISGVVGQSMNIKEQVGKGNQTYANFTIQSNSIANLNPDIGIDVTRTSTGSGTQYTTYLTFTGIPMYAYSGTYTITIKTGSGLTTTYTGDLTITANEQAGTAINAGTSAKPISYIDKWYYDVQHHSDYYIFLYSKVYIPTDFKATITSGFGLEYQQNYVFQSSTGNMVVFGYLQKTGTCTITFDKGNGTTDKITLHVVADKTGTASSPIDDLSRSLATFANMASPNSESGNAGSGKTYCLEKGSYVGIWYHQLNPNSRGEITDIEPSMPGVSITSTGDAYGYANEAGTYKFTIERNGTTATTTIVVIDPNAVKLSSVSISVSGGGDSITLTAKPSPSNASIDEDSLTWSFTSGGSYVSSSESGMSITLTPESNGRAQVKVSLTDMSGTTKTATDYIYVFAMAFYLNGGDGGEPSTILKIDDSSSYTIDIPSSEPWSSSYAFMGWSTSSSGVGTLYKYGTTYDSYGTSYSSVRNMYAVWGHEGFVSFDANGGDWSEEVGPVLVRLDDYESVRLPTSEPLRDSDYDFLFWTDGDGGEYGSGDYVDVYAGETTYLTAVWAVRTTITFIVNQGDGGPGEVDYWIQEDTSDYVTLPSSSYNPYKVGASFKGWSEYSSGSGTIYQPSGSFELDAGRPDMLYAVWDDLDYTLSFSTGKVDSSLVSGMPSEPMRDSNQDGYASFQLEGWVPTATGYEFLGWALNNPNASTPDYTSPTATIRLDYDQNNSTLTAVWKTLTLYTLKFDVGEGTGTIADVTGWSGEGYCNLEVTSQAPTRENWQFLGWHDTAGQSTAKYHAGDSITLTESEGTTKTIYAVYVQNIISISGTPEKTAITTGTAWSFTPTVSETGCTLEVTGADWLTAGNGTVSGTPGADDDGTYHITITASKDNYQSASMQITIVVVPQLDWSTLPTGGVIAYAI